MKEEKIRQGEKIDLYLGKGPYYRTVADDLPDDGVLLAPIPSYGGIPIILKANQNLKVYFYRENGRYSFDARVEGLDLTGNVKMMKLNLLSPPERQQRREYFRVKKVLRAILRPYYLGPFPLGPESGEEDEMENVTTFNISAAGVAVKSTGEYEVGEQLYIRIFLEWPEPCSQPIDFLGEIRQIIKLDAGKNIFQMGIMFADISPDMSSLVGKFVIAEDRRRSRQIKMMEE